MSDRTAQLCLYVVIGLHHILVAGLVVSFVSLPFTAHWTVALPLMVLLWTFVSSPVKCRLTDLENWLRRRVGWPEIKGFVGYYYLGQRCRPDKV